MDIASIRTFASRIFGVIAVALWLLAWAVPVSAQSFAEKLAVAEAAADDRALAEFYKSRDYDALWTGADDRARRAALLKALDAAQLHGLPVSRHDGDRLARMFRAARTPRDVGQVEVEASRMFLQYARDIQTGVLDPSTVDDGIKRRPKRRDRLAQITAFSKSTPDAYLRSLIPSSIEYNRLLAEKLRLEKIVGDGGWGAEVPGGKLEPGDSGPRVVALRNRLVRMGYMARSAVTVYDAAVQRAVQLFQQDHGLFSDGVVGEDTMAAINRPALLRLQQVIVAMERERWLGADRGRRHVLVNIPDFHARLVEDGKVVFMTRSVVGLNSHDRRTPEFSDTMEHMIINPTWHVPRSIAVKEYLPMMKENPNAAGHLRLYDASGRVVNRNAVDFTRLTPGNFPFDLKQPPSRSNALGLVKFMFPNRYNIYLHDTPQKSLFLREERDFSHGCVRLNDPFEFAYELLAGQQADPVGYFQSLLATGRETQVNLENPLPVHLIYRTAFTRAKGRVQYRNDIYGRDARIFDALRDAGVVLRAVRS